MSSASDHEGRAPQEHEKDQRHRPEIRERTQSRLNTMSNMPTQDEGHKHERSSIDKAASHNPTQNENHRSRPTRPTHGTTRGPSRMQTAKTAMSRQKTNISRQRTGLSKVPSHMREERQRAQAEQAQNSQEAEVDPEYYELNPWYGQKQDQPVFGLNKPLPHTVRTGMRGRPENRDEQEAQEEEETEAAQLYHEPGREPDLEKGEGDHTGEQEDRDDERRNKHGRENKKRGRTSRSRSMDYFDQTPDRSRSEHETDVPVLPPGEEGIEKGEIPTTFSGQTDLWQDNVRRRASGLSRNAPSTRQVEPIQEEESEPDPSRETPRASSQPSHRSTAVGSDFEFSDKERADFMDPDELQVDYDQYRNKVAKLRAYCPRVLGEFWGTSVAICLGICVNLSVKVSQNQTSQFGSYETQCWGWGLGFMIGIYLCAGISGAHLNPVISVVLCIFRGFNFVDCLRYIVCQIAGGFFGAGLAYVVYQDALNAVDPARTTELTGTAFYPGPQSAIPMRTSTAFFSEFMATGFLILIILALGDDQNAPPGAGLSPLIIGLVIVVLMMALGYNTGPTLSPARDLGPRTVAYAVGYKDAFTGYSGWGAWGATLAGGICGALVYDIFVFQGSESPVNMTWSQLQHGMVRRRVHTTLWLQGLPGRFRAWARELCIRTEKKTAAAVEDIEQVAKEAIDATADAVHSGDRRKVGRSNRKGVPRVYGGRTAR